MLEKRHRTCKLDAQSIYFRVRIEKVSVRMERVASTLNAVGPWHWAVLLEELQVSAFKRNVRGSSWPNNKLLTKKTIS